MCFQVFSVEWTTNRRHTKTAQNQTRQEPTRQETSRTFADCRELRDTFHRQSTAYRPTHIKATKIAEGSNLYLALFFLANFFIALTSFSSTTHPRQTGAPQRQRGIQCSAGHW